MKKLLAAIIICSGLVANAQFKDDNQFTPSVKDGIINANTGGNIFGFINPNNFTMHHSYSLSFSSFGGGNNMALGVYTNSMAYKFNEDLNVQLDASFVHSPYSSFGKNVQNSINGIYISNAQLNYQPWKDFHVTVQYRNVPNSFYGPYGYGYGSFFNDGLFDSSVR
jgi:hypothetical protein